MRGRAAFSLFGCWFESITMLCFLCSDQLLLFSPQGSHSTAGDFDSEVDSTISSRRGSRRREKHRNELQGAVQGIVVANSLSSSNSTPLLFHLPCQYSNASLFDFLSQFLMVGTDQVEVDMKVIAMKVHQWWAVTSRQQVTKIHQMIKAGNLTTPLSPVVVLAGFKKERINIGNITLFTHLVHK